MSIYQRPDKSAESQGNPPYVGTIKVRVQANENPLALVLSSYSKVYRKISLDPGTRLKAILLSGPHGSSMNGQGNVRVVAIGNAYSYVLGSPEYTLLQNEVYTWTGKRIGLFQCGYQASDFTDLAQPLGQYGSTARQHLGVRAVSVAIRQAVLMGQAFSRLNGEYCPAYRGR